MAKAKLPKSCRRPRKYVRAACFDALRAQGWSVQSRAWPTFLAFKDGTFAFVNTETRRSKMNEVMLRDLFTVLTKGGIQCYTYSPSTKFTRFRLPDAGSPS